jgi:tetratricopeptide (TPR) repeat protein
MRLIQEDAVERFEAAKAATAQRPDDPAAWIALSQACHVLVDEEGMIEAARRAFALQPESVDALRQLAYSLNQTGPGAAEARPLFERLQTLVPDDAVALHYLSNYALFDGDYRRVIELLEKLERRYPGSSTTSARIARAYALLGDAIGAAKYYAQAATRCDGASEPFPYGSSASLKPMFTALAGDRANAERLSLQLCQEDGVGLANLANPRYPDDCEARISQLRERVAGRDLCVFGFGPSLADISYRKKEMGSRDFASMTLSSFPIVENDLLRPIGRRIDLICITHPTVLKLQGAALREWFSSVPLPTLVLPLWLREYATVTGSPDFLLENQQHVFWFDCFRDDLPPSPHEPLHFPSINTLICALGVGLLARPRRIFLFGFDGQIKGSDIQQEGAIYYRENDDNYYSPRRRVELEIRWLAKVNLLWDSVRFNEVAPFVLRHLGLLFDLPMPPIYNVCVDSALDTFPRITVERFFEIVSAGGN